MLNFELNISVALLSPLWSRPTYSIAFYSDHLTLTLKESQSQCTTQTRAMRYDACTVTLKLMCSWSVAKVPFKIQRKKTMSCENYSMLEVEPNVVLRLMENVPIVINTYSIDLRSLSYQWPRCRSTTIRSSDMTLDVDVGILLRNTGRC